MDRLKKGASPHLTIQRKNRAFLAQHELGACKQSRILLPDRQELGAPANSRAWWRLTNDQGKRVRGRQPCKPLNHPCIHGSSLPAEDM